MSDFETSNARTTPAVVSADLYDADGKRNAPDPLWAVPAFWRASTTEVVAELRRRIVGELKRAQAKSSGQAWKMAAHKMAREMMIPELPPWGWRDE